MYGPPGTGKTLLARACAAQTDATFLKLAGPQLVQMFIGDGAKLVRDCFALAKEKAPSIIFIDELDAVGTKRFDSEKSGDREVQRTMLELLNQLDGFASDDRVKVLAATNRVDVLDPALLRSGRLDRKIEFPLPNEEARAQILKIHSRKMTVDDAVNWPELARSTDEFGGAQLKAVCVEAGMIALRKGMVKIGHEHYVDAIAEVQAKKKVILPLSTPFRYMFADIASRRILSISTPKGEENIRILHVRHSGSANSCLPIAWRWRGKCIIIRKIVKHESYSTRNVDSLGPLSRIGIEDDYLNQQPWKSCSLKRKINSSHTLRTYDPPRELKTGQLVTLV